MLLVGKPNLDVFCQTFTCSRSVIFKRLKFGANVVKSCMPSTINITNNLDMLKMLRSEVYHLSKAFFAIFSIPRSNCVTVAWLTRGLLITALVSCCTLWPVCRSKVLLDTLALRLTNVCCGLVNTRPTGISCTLRHVYSLQDPLKFTELINFPIKDLWTNHSTAVLCHISWCLQYANANHRDIH